MARKGVGKEVVVVVGGFGGVYIQETKQRKISSRMQGGKERRKKSGKGCMDLLKPVDFCKQKPVEQCLLF